jgi:predicted phosphodiesterase
MRCAIISDIHGNLDALEAVLADAGTVDQVWCLGDVVGYGPQPNECIDRLRECHALCVAGNHDRACTGAMDTAEFNPEASEAARWTQEQLTPDRVTFLAELAEQLNAGQDGDFTLVHGSPREPVWEYLTHVSIARLNFDYFQTRYCLVGHTHVPLIFQRPWPDERAPDYRTIVPQPGTPITLGPHRVIVNPGSVGQPRDGNPDAAYMIYESAPAAPRSLPPRGGRAPAAAEETRGTLTLRRVAYPVAAVQEKMRAAGLPPRLIMRLTYGW